jgi:hypothetical protein
MQDAYKLQHVLKERESLNKTIMPYTLSTRCEVERPDKVTTGGANKNSSMELGICPKIDPTHLF